MYVPSKPKKNQSTRPTAPTSVHANLQAFQPLPSHEQISQRAYAIYEKGGAANGQDQQDWFRAEQEMFAAGKQ
jgi:hypothetical protein